MATAPAVILAIAQTENAPAREQRKPVAQETNRLDDTVVPYKLDSLFIVDLKVNYKELIESLRKKTDLNEVSACDATVVFSSDDLEVWQLPPLAGTLLRLCDGRRTVAEITREFALLEIELNDITSDKACLFGLVQLIEDGVLGLSSEPLRWDGDPMPQFTFPPKATNTQQPWPPDAPRNVL
jgi:predicted transposase YbfD/YdcC